MTNQTYDFGGYATKANLKCSDGRVILKDAFKDNDGAKVPLVWQHQHNESTNVLGHAKLENRDDGVYAYCTFNETEAGKNAKLLVSHGDITYLSIYANQLVEKAKNVIHGMIREVSLVLAGANPGAVIDNLAFEHGDGDIVTSDDEAIIYTGVKLDQEKEEEIMTVSHADGAGDKTVGEVFDTLNEEQKTAVYAIVAAALDGEGEENADEAEHSDEGDTTVMKNNVFEGSAMGNDRPRQTLTHDLLNTIMTDAKKIGSLKQAFIAHIASYGIENIDYLFPDARTLTNEPTFIQRDMEWVPIVFNGARHSPFSRIKTVQADITGENARALGYTKGGLKKEEVFSLLRRTTTPTTVYKKQKLDRDDVVDITDLDVVVWLKREMRMLLDEEIARAILITDGRAAESEDKIDETCIRPIWTDADLYAYKYQLESTVTDPLDVMDEIVRSRINYKGSGSPTLFMGTTFLTECILVRDESTNRRVYPTEAEAAAAMRVSRIVEVPLMDDLTREVDGTEYELLGILVNMRDYTIGADKGGGISMFDDFDLDYNQYKYLMETRCSGALTLPNSAVIIEREVSGG